MNALFCHCWLEEGIKIFLTLCSLITDGPKIGFVHCINSMDPCGLNLLFFRWNIYCLGLFVIVGLSLFIYHGAAERKYGFGPDSFSRIKPHTHFYFCIGDSAPHAFLNKTLCSFLAKNFSSVHVLENKWHKLIQEAKIHFWCKYGENPRQLKFLPKIIKNMNKIT